MTGAFAYLDNSCEEKTTERGTSLPDRAAYYAVAATVASGLLFAVFSMDKPDAYVAFVLGASLAFSLLLFFTLAVETIVAAIHDIGRSDKPNPGPSGP